MKWIGWFGLERVCRGLLTSEASIEVKLVENRVATRVPNACLASPAIRRISECERGLAARVNHETKGHVANGMQIRVFLENCLCLNVCGYLALMH